MWEKMVYNYILKTKKVHDYKQEVPKMGYPLSTPMKNP